MIEKRLKFFCGWLGHRQKIKNLRVNNWLDGVECMQHLCRE